MSCCRPHADQRQQKLCPIGAGLFGAYTKAAERYSRLCGIYDPPEASSAMAAEEREAAHRRYRDHTDYGWVPEPEPVAAL